MPFASTHIQECTIFRISAKRHISYNTIVCLLNDTLLRSYLQTGITLSVGLRAEASDRRVRAAAPRVRSRVSGDATQRRIASHTAQHSTARVSTLHSGFHGFKGMG